MSEEDKTAAEQAIEQTPDSASKTSKQKKDEAAKANKDNAAMNADNPELVGPNDPPEKAIVRRRSE